LPRPQVKDLDTNATEEEILDEATRDANGQVEKALLHWVKPGNPAHTSLETVLAGRIWIDGRTLKAEVNSAGRDKAFRGIIKRALGRQARYRSSTERAIEDIVPPLPEGGTSAMRADSIRIAIPRFWRACAHGWDWGLDCSHNQHVFYLILSIKSTH
jgi:hypothetical protein